MCSHLLQKHWVVTEPTISQYFSNIEEHRPTDQSRQRWNSNSLFCLVKRLFLLMESGGFEVRFTSTLFFVFFPASWYKKAFFFFLRKREILPVILTDSSISKKSLSVAKTNTFSEDALVKYICPHWLDCSYYSLVHRWLQKQSPHTCTVRSCKNKIQILTYHNSPLDVMTSKHEGQKTAQILLLHIDSPFSQVKEWSSLKWQK